MFRIERRVGRGNKTLCDSWTLGPVTKKRISCNGSLNKKSYHIGWILYIGENLRALLSQNFIAIVFACSHRLTESKKKRENNWTEMKVLVRAIINANVQKIICSETRYRTASQVRALRRAQTSAQTKSTPNAATCLEISKQRIQGSQLWTAKQETNEQKGRGRKIFRWEAHFPKQ